jgi:hypothetical protein
MPWCAFSEEKVAGLSEEGYARLFLDAKDFPTGMEQVQDVRRGAGARDEKFRELKGEQAGFLVWMAKTTDTSVWRVADARWVFPSEEAAKAYLLGSLQKLSEGTPEDKGAPKVGEDCHVFGPENPRVNEILGVKLRYYIYIFRSKNVVVKLFVSQGSASKQPLEAKTVASLSKAIVKRIEESAK